MLQTDCTYSRVTPSRTASEFAMLRAMESLGDPFLCVRIHGLVVLRELILAEDSCAMRDIARLLDLLKTQLASEDEYETKPPVS